MEIVERMENKLLNRVEIKFSWRHSGKATPSRREVMDLVKTLEPKTNPDYIVIKDCNTRFGQPLTTGLAYIYDNEESMKVEPKYIHKRHEGFRSTSEKPAAAEEEAPAEEAAPEEEAAPADEPAEEEAAEEEAAEEGGDE
tara:strand:+ start:1043 stop:1462 length:420 start_codon:yes stop_codon:yes gene_type:complete